MKNNCESEFLVSCSDCLEMIGENNEAQSSEHLLYLHYFSLHAFCSMNTLWLSVFIIVQA